MAALKECAEYAVPSRRPANWLVCLRILFTNAMVTNFPEDRAYTGPSEDYDLSLARKCTGQNFVSGFLSKNREWPLFPTEHLGQRKNSSALSSERETSAHLKDLHEALLAWLDTRSPTRAQA